MKIKEICELRDDIRHYADRLETAIGIVPGDDYKITMTKSEAIDILSLLLSYKGAIENTEVQSIWQP